MSDPVIRLDSSKDYSECRGERTPDDPHYRVHYMQGRKVGSKMVLLPFDAQGVLVPDDGKKEPYAGTNVEGKPVIHQPLYNADMRALAERLTKKLAGPTEAAAQPDEIDEDEELAEKSNPADDVNFVSWLRGEVRYTPQVLRAAAKARYHVTFTDIAEMVAGLVIDEKVIAEDQVCAELKRHLPPRAA